MNMELLRISAKSADPTEREQTSAIPVRSVRRLPNPGPMFMLVVVLPVIAAIAYYGFLASDVYISESEFVVRSPQKASISPLGALLQTAGVGNASAEAE